MLFRVVQGLHERLRLRDGRLRLLLFPSGQVVAVLDELEAVGVRAWVAGGWGVDALLGRQTRRHYDLDLVIDTGDEQRALSALARLGYHSPRRAHAPAALLPERLILNNLTGDVLDLHPVDVEVWLKTVAAVRIAAGDDPAEAAFATGYVAGRPVSCLSPALQAAAHTGYELRRIDHRDLELLATGGQPQHAGCAAARSFVRSAVVVSVPEVGRLLESSDVSPRDLNWAPGMPPHITLLFPFLGPDELDDEARTSLAELAGKTAAFDFSLARVDRFPGVTYLAPEPAERFVAITQALVERWPEHPPYGGAHDQIVPHLTIAEGPVPHRLVEAIEQKLPLGRRAGEISLVVESTDGTWRLEDRFPLGE